MKPKWTRDPNVKSLLESLRRIDQPDPRCFLYDCKYKKLRVRCLQRKTTSIKNKNPQKKIKYYFFFFVLFLIITDLTKIWGADTWKFIRILLTTFFTYE